MSDVSLHLNDLRAGIWVTSPPASSARLLAKMLVGMRNLTLCLTNVYGRPEMRGHGVVTALVWHAMVCTVELDVARISLLAEGACVLDEIFGRNVIGRNAHGVLTMTIFVVDRFLDREDEQHDVAE